MIPTCHAVLGGPCIHVYAARLLPVHAMLRLHVQDLTVTHSSMQHARQSIEPSPLCIVCKAATANQYIAGIAQVKGVHGRSPAAIATALLVRAKDEKASTMLGGTPEM